MYSVIMIDMYGIFENQGMVVFPPDGKFRALFNVLTYQLVD
jgi:hypothetical protein